MLIMIEENEVTATVRSQTKLLDSVLTRSLRNTDRHGATSVNCALRIYGRKNMCSKGQTWLHNNLQAHTYCEEKFCFQNKPEKKN